MMGPDFDDGPKPTPPSMSEIFKTLCPYYMMYGMSYDEYWYGDPWRMVDYKAAYELRNRRENQMMWIQGIYVVNALSVVIGNAFSKRGTPQKKYFEKPLEIFPKTEAEEKAEMEKKRREIIMKLTAWKKSFDASKAK